MDEYEELKKAVQKIERRRLVCKCGHGEIMHYRGAKVELLHESDCTIEGCECKKFENKANA